MSKRGFTLAELLVVIALIGVLAVFTLPNFIKIFSDNKDALSTIQKQQIENAVNMYISDYCTEPISDTYECPSSWQLSTDSNGVKTVYDASIDLGDLEYYFDSSENCSGYIEISNGKMDLSHITCNFNN